MLCYLAWQDINARGVGNEKRHPLHRELLQIVVKFYCMGIIQITNKWSIYPLEFLIFYTYNALHRFLCSRNYPLNFLETSPLIWDWISCDEPLEGQSLVTCVLSEKYSFSVIIVAKYSVSVTLIMCVFLWQSLYKTYHASMSRKACGISLCVQ